MSPQRNESRRTPESDPTFEVDGQPAERVARTAHEAPPATTNARSANPPHPHGPTPTEWLHATGFAIGYCTLVYGLLVLCLSWR